MTTSEMMSRPAVAMVAGTTGKVAAQAFIGTSSLREARPACQIRRPGAVYLRHPDIQPKVRELMVVRARLSSSPLSVGFLKANVFFARIRTR